MKNMKKILVALMIFSVMTASLFATTPVGPGVDGSADYYSAVGSAFSPISTRSMGMGGAGIAIAGRSDSFFMNPAALASRRFQLSLPSLGVTVYNPQAILKSGMIDDLQAASSNKDKYVDAAQKYLGIISSKGFNEVLTTDLAVSLTAGGFGLGIQVQEKVHSYSPDGKTTSTQLLAEVNAAATLGFGFRINIVEDKFSIDLGVAARFNYRAYNSAVSADNIITTFLGSGDTTAAKDKFLKETPLMAGWAIPIDAGININMPAGFTVSVVARNMNGTFYMNAYPGISNWTNELFKKPLTSDGSVGSGDKTSFKITTPWSLDAGIGWAPSFGKVGTFIKPALAIDLVDIVGLAGGDFNTEKLLTHLNMGAEIRLLSFIDVRAGLNQGYISIGAGLDLWALRIEAAYYRQEFGVQLGDKPVDALTVRANIGYDR